MKPFDWIMIYIKKYQLRMILGLLATTATTGLALTSPYIMGLIADKVFAKQDTGALLPLLIAMISLTALKSVIRYVSLMNYEKVSQNVIFNLRQDLYKRVQVQSYKFFDNNKVGDIMSRMTGDLEAIRIFVAGTIYSLYENVLTFFVAIGLMFTISWQITLGMLLAAPLICYITIKQSKEIKPYFTEIREQFSKLNSVCQENISGNRVVKAFTREDYEIQKFTVENQTYYDKNVQSAEIWMKYLPVQEFIAGLMQVFLLFAGGLMAIFGKVEVWQLVTINGYLWAVNNPMRIFGWLMNDIQRFNASLDKIYSMTRERIEIKNPKEAFEKKRINGDVEFKDVSFSYDGKEENYVLKNISFSAKRGSTIGIVGPTGSGKTTLVNMLSRFYDTSAGKVLIDDRDVKEYDLYSLRKGISSAMQDVFLFSDTIEGNLAYGVPDAPMEAVTDAAQVANAYDFILHMEEGFDTIVGERGVGLSGGQKQRLSLARAIIVNPSILILDDTTSAVDMETEHEIQTALKEKYSDRTTFIIAHRISSVKHADIILVIVEGEIIERGTHDELMAMNGYYCSLFNEQYSGFMAELEGAVN